MIRRIFIFLLLFCISYFLSSCQIGYKFVPIDKEYFNNLEFNSVKFKINYFQVSCCSEYFMLNIIFINPAQKKISLNKNISIRGKYYKDDNDIEWGCSEKEVKRKKYGSIHSYSFHSNSKELNVTYSGYLESLSKREISFFDVIKNEIFTIYFPEITINDSTFIIESKEFCYIDKNDD